jgi:hypothetical protein
MDLYFQRHDGQAVTCDDFMAAMSDANGKDVSRLSLWYSQAGTPTLTVNCSYDSTTSSFTITLSQSFPSSCISAQPCLIPCRMALFGSDGRALPLVLNGVSLGTECVLELDRFSQTYNFTEVGSCRPIPSLLRGFSAPVNCVVVGQSDGDLQFLLSHDSDGFNRNEVLSRVATRAGSLSECVNLFAGQPAACQALHYQTLRCSGRRSACPRRFGTDGGRGRFMRRAGSCLSCRYCGPAVRCSVESSCAVFALRQRTYFSDF